MLQGRAVLSVVTGLHTTGDRGWVWVWAGKNFRCSLDVSASKPTALLLLLHALLVPSGVGTRLISCLGCSRFSLSPLHSFNLPQYPQHDLDVFLLSLASVLQRWNLTYHLVYQLFLATAQCNTGQPQATSEQSCRTCL